MQIIYLALLGAASAFVPHGGGFTRPGAPSHTGRCAYHSGRTLSMLAHPMMPPAPTVVDSVEVVKSVRAAPVQGRVYVGEMHGAFPMSVPVMQLAEADFSSFAGGAAALLVIAGGLVASQGKSDESSSSSSSSSPTPPTPTAPAAPSSKETPVETPAPTKKVSVGAKAALLSKESSKTQEEIAKAYDKAREETQEISRIKNDFIARLEMAGRQSTIRLATMGEQGLAAYNSASASAESEKSSDSLPEEVFLRSTPMNLAKRNAIEANRKQWGIGYDPKKPQRTDVSK